MKALEQVIAEHRLRIDTTGPQPRIACSCGWIGPPTGTEVHAHAAHVAAMWREERTVRSLPELDALPTHTVIQCIDGLALVLAGNGYIRCDSPNRVYTARVGGALLPALVLWHPDEGAV